MANETVRTTETTRDLSPKSNADVKGGALAFSSRLSLRRISVRNLSVKSFRIPNITDLATGVPSGGCPTAGC